MDKELGDEVESPNQGPGLVYSKTTDDDGSSAFHMIMCGNMNQPIKGKGSSNHKQSRNNECILFGCLIAIDEGS